MDFGFESQRTHNVILSRRKKNKIKVKNMKEEIKDAIKEEVIKQLTIWAFLLITSFLRYTAEQMTFDLLNALLPLFFD